MAFVLRCLWLRATALWCSRGAGRSASRLTSGLDDQETLRLGVPRSPTASSWPFFIDIAITGSGSQPHATCTLHRDVHGLAHELPGIARLRRRDPA